jgi:hypothetical protein
MAYEFRIKNGLISNGPATFSGSVTSTGNITAPQLVGTASLATTASYWSGSIVHAQSASIARSASYAVTASYATNLEITGSITSVDWIDFHTASAAPTWKSGRVFWDNTDGALSVYNAEADVTMQLGQESWTRVRNNTGTTITNGTLVRLSGAQGDVPTVVRAQSIQKSGSVNTDNQILGVATHDIETNSFGYVTTLGLVRGLNTSTFNDGDNLFVGTGSAGVIQNTAPQAPFEIIPVGVCVKAGPGGSGIIYVAVQQPVDFSDLSSAQVSGTYSYGDLWSYQQTGSVGVWRHTNQLSGSYGVTGSWSATSFTGSLRGTATSASYALSASWAPSTPTFPFTGSARITGSLFVNGAMTQGDPGNTATGLHSHAEGNNNQATGQYAHAEGVVNIASGNNSHAEGFFNTVSGEYSHAEGEYNTITSFGSHAEGTGNEISGYYSHAEGAENKVFGNYSHAEGWTNTIYGNFSHAEGLNTTTVGAYSHAEGQGTITVSDTQHAQGMYNLPISGAGAFIVGNGDIVTRRNLIFAQGTTVQVTGSLQVSGSITATGSVTINNNRIDDAWTSYTPTFTSNGGSQPALDNGTITGFYKVIGKTCFVRVKLNPGSGTTFGGGALLFGLPVNAKSADGIQFPCSIMDQGNAWYQATVNGTYSGFTDKSAIIVQSAGGGNSSEAVTGMVPITFGASDSIQFNGSYEIA